MGFTGFPDDAFAFFEAVAADTTWETVGPRQQLHERAVRAPMVALTAALEPEFGRAYVYRLHRSPTYWLTKYAYVALADTIVLGVSFSLEGLAVEGGWLYSSSDQVERYRTAVGAAAGGRLEKTLADLREEGFELLGVRLKSAPRGYAADPSHIELLKYRSLVATRNLGRGPWLHTSEAADRVRTEWRRLQPLTDWLVAHVGPRDGR